MNNIQIPWPDWKIVKTIGHGSFGAVYEIERQNFDFTEKAALKVISLPQNKHDIDEMYSEGYDSESITLRLEGYLKDIVREYSLMAKMKGHPNIVYCDDLKYIPHADGIGWDIFIRMELLTPLTKVLPDYIPDSMVISLATDICNALIHCKSQNIIHRDIKPQNIFIGNTGTYKLGDFGVAKISEHTTSGTKAGTYKYMAPEVYKNEPYGSSSDIYSLGLVMYWMLNERRAPFLPLPPQVPTIVMDEEARWKRFTGTPLPEPANGSAELKRIVLKACAYNPKDRYSSAAEMLEDLLCADEKTTYLLHTDETFTQIIQTEDFEEVSLLPEYTEMSANETEYSEMPTSKPAYTTASPLESDFTETPPVKPIHASDKKSKMPLLIILGALLIVIAIGAIFILPKDKPSENNSEASISVELSFKPQLDNIASGARQTAIILSDGTAISDGSNEFGQCDIDDWKDLISVSSGDFFTLGLHEDGTVSAAGDNEFGQCDVENWKNVIAISAGDYQSIGLCEDGSILTAGKNTDGQCDVEPLEAKQSDSVKIIAVSTSYNHTVALYSDGTVEAVGSNSDGQCDVQDWTDVVKVYAGVRFTVGLKNDGTLLATGTNKYGQCDVENWDNISLLSVGDFHTIAVTEDGQVLSAGRNDYGQCDVEDWDDIAEIGAGCKHTVAVTNDGQILVAGSNEFDQWKIADYSWK